MDESMARLKSGAVITVSVVVFAALLLYVGDMGQWFAKSQTFTAYFEDIKFIKKETKVTVGGFVVGQVSNVTPPSRSQKRGWVQLEIKIDRGLKLMDNASLKLSRDGLLGERYLDLNLGDDFTVELADGSRRVGKISDPDADPVVVRVLSRTETWSRSELKGAPVRAKSLARGLEILHTSVDPTLADMGKQLDAFRPQIAATLRNISEIVREMRSIFESGELRDIIAEVKASVQQLRTDASEAMTHVSDVLAEAEEAIADVRRVIRDNEPHIKGSTAHAEEFIKGLQSRIDEVKKELLTALKTVNGMILENQKSVTRSVDNLEATTWYMKQFSRKLNNNPSVLIFGADDPTTVEPKRDDSAYREQGRLPPYPREP